MHVEQEELGEQETATRRILVVEDDRSHRWVLRRVLENSARIGSRWLLSLQSTLLMQDFGKRRRKEGGFIRTILIDKLPLIRHRCSKSKRLTQIGEQRARGRSPRKLRVLRFGLRQSFLGNGRYNFNARVNFVFDRGADPFANQ